MDPREYAEEMDDENIHDKEEGDDMKKRFPNSTEGSRNAGRFIGVDFPYVPGDPDF